MKYYQRIMVEAPSEIKLHPDLKRYAMMAIFCYIRKQIIIDSLASALSDASNKVKIKAETSIKAQIISDVTQVQGKFDILFSLAKITADMPDGVIKESIYPEVDQETLKNLANELKHRGNWYEQNVKVKMRSLYFHHHRRLLFPIIEALHFHSHHTENQPLINAIDFIRNQKSNSNKLILLDDTIPIEGVVPKSWKSLVIEKISDNKYINKINYELSVLEMLRRRLSCKSIWVAGAYRYRNPDEDLPLDFNENKEHYFKLLNLPNKAGTYIDELKSSMKESLQQLNKNFQNNDKVDIINDDSIKIKISPSRAQAQPQNIDSLKTDIVQRWSTISLLDVFKEAALSTNFLKHFHTIGHHEKLDPNVLWKRLLLCLYGIGTNTGLKRISSGNTDVTYSDLRYIKRRFITAPRIRDAITEVVDATLTARNPLIWGEYNMGCACDSTKVSVWDQNLMSEWHIRYRGPGIMIYWHVDKKSLCIYSQMKTCSSSEVASMMQGILHHSTKMNIKEAYTDTHEQSLVGFAFSHLLHFDLLPRIKAINREKLHLPDEASRYDFENLGLILKSPINWNLIHDNYDDIVKYTAALKLGIVDSDIILKRFNDNNQSHPVYKALIELGKAVKTIFLCRYLSSEELRIEINESQNVVERVNGFMDFIFFGKLGEISTNKSEDQEIAILCMHLLQASLVYLNTLLIQDVLSEDYWTNKLTSEDKRALTPLIHLHINPYGLFPLDVNSRIKIKSSYGEQNGNQHNSHTTEEESKTVC